MSYTLSVLLINGGYGYKFVLIFHLSSDVTGHTSVKPELTQLSLNFKTSRVSVYKCSSLIVGFASLSQFGQGRLSLDAISFYAFASFWAMSLVGVYPGRASTVQEKLNSFDCMLFPTVLYANATGTVVYQYILISNGPTMNKIWTKM